MTQSGIAVAWIDSHPSWDDTGVTAVAVMIVVAELPGNVGVLLAVPFALAGAYARSLIRRG